MKGFIVIAGRAFVVSRSISADDLLGPDYLAFEPGDFAEAQVMAAYALANVPDLPEPLVRPGRTSGDFAVLIAGPNFGSGSARAHPAAALAAAGIRAVLAPSFALRFHRTIVNGAWFAPVVAPEAILLRIAHGSHVALNLSPTECALTLEDGDPLVLPGLGVIVEILAAEGLRAMIGNEEPSARS